MTRYISKHLREFVISRAQQRCEYCKIFANYSFLSFHIEHVVSIKHGGLSTEFNLAYSCPICNLNKGSEFQSSRFNN